MVARPAQRWCRQVVRLSALVLLATLLVVASTTVTVRAPAPGGSGGPALGATTSGPSATAVRPDARVLALRGSQGSTDLDLIGGHLLPYRSAGSGTGWPVPAGATGPREAGDAQPHQERAPPQTR